MAKPLNTERYLTRRWAYGSAALVYYVRVGGNDDNDGLSPVTAFATLDRALHYMSIAEVNVPVVADITGMTIDSSTVLNLGGTTLGGISSDVDLTATSPNNFFSRRHRQIRSELVLGTALTVTGSSFNATTGLLSLTVSNVLVANALQGQFAVGSALGEYGVIRSNTGGAGPNTIEVANIVGLTNPVGAYVPGASMEYGDAANFFEQAIYLNALCDWSFQGITFTSNGPKAAAVSIWPNSPVTFTLCNISGMDIQAGPGVVTLDGCYVRDQTFAQNGATVAAQQSVFRGLAFLCHGSSDSGLNEWTGVAIDACNAYGGGNLESRYTFQLTNFGIDSAVGAGVNALFGVSRLEDGIIANCGGSAISASNHVTLTVDNIDGTANVGYGVVASYGAIVIPVNTPAVTGTLNDLFVGALGATTWAAVAAAPITDLDQLVRVGA